MPEEQQPVVIPPEKLSLLSQSVNEFFNGESLEHTLTELNDLKITTITESYGELDKSDKWFVVDFFNRLHLLIGNLYAVCKG